MAMILLFSAPIMHNGLRLSKNRQSPIVHPPGILTLSLTNAGVITCRPYTDGPKHRLCVHYLRLCSWKSHGRSPSAKLTIISDGNPGPEPQRAVETTLILGSRGDTAYPSENPLNHGREVREQGRRSDSNGRHSLVHNGSSIGHTYHQFTRILLCIGWVFVAVDGTRPLLNWHR